MRSLRILHMEENPEDAQLLVGACRATGLPAEFFRVRDGSEAVAYLEGRDEFADRARHPLPDVIVLGLRSSENGFDVLRWLRRQAEFASAPVLVFTASASAEDRARVMDEGATGYFAKPKDFERPAGLADFLRRFDG